MKISRLLAAVALSAVLVAPLFAGTRQIAPGDPAEARLRALDDADELVSSTNAAAVAETTSDAEALIGLSLLVDEPPFAREKIVAKAVGLDSTLGPLAALITGSSRWTPISMKPATSVAEGDASNALGHYLQASALLDAGDILGAIMALRKGAACEKLDAYDDRMARCLRAAIGVLKLRGPAKFKALGLATSQGPPIWGQLEGLPEKTARAMEKLPVVERAPVAEHILGMAGQIASMPKTHQAAKRALREALINAYTIRAEAAAAESKAAEERGYRRTVEVMKAYDWGIRDDEEQNDFDEAAILVLWGGSAVSLTEILALDPRVSGEAREKVVAAIEKQEEAGRRFLEQVDSSFDYFLDNAFVVGAPLRISAGERRDLSEAARKVVEACTASRETVKEQVPRYRNILGLLRVGLGIAMYQPDHGEAFPATFDELVEKKYVDGPEATKSAATNQAFYYQAPVDGLDGNSPSLPTSIVAYDPPVEGSDIYIVLWGDLHVSRMTTEKFREQLAKQAKK